ncbi:DNA polymerase [Friedmanniella endophytica]|uniref:Type-4 uracil-DNA glycosylase n=1 Tax=Microlunatus kandeliicorticis TaxID=1759536 RepID=A0A7W3IQF1_9ACTN|nr:UdgX family uracil-DNA binding protein [Microlunatus kandeliicorticis]MBA8793314.1 DNA polymerase [Microlunatus kandeliicorticis]
MPAHPAPVGAAQWVDPDADVPALREAAAGCRGCELWEPATQVVFSAGNDHAPLMLVGEQPGDQEDQRGIPFVGPAGQVLQRALAEAGIERSRVYVTNAVKHFRFELRGKRRIHQTPQVSHIKACKPWLEAEVAQVRPALVIALGATAGKSLLGSDFRITQQRGRRLEAVVGPTTVPVVATIHPSAVLRTEEGPDRDAAYAGLVADLRTALAEAG